MPVLARFLDELAVPVVGGSCESERVADLQLMYLVEPGEGECVSVDGAQLAAQHVLADFEDFVGGGDFHPGLLPVFQLPAHLALNHRDEGPDAAQVCVLRVDACPLGSDGEHVDDFLFGDFHTVDPPSAMRTISIFPVLLGLPANRGGE